MLGCVYNTDSDVNRHQDHSQAWVLESTGLGSLESPIETRRGFTVRVAHKEVRITLAMSREGTVCLRGTA